MKSPNDSAGFDPNAYLAAKAPAPGFNPDSYLASKEPQGFDPDKYVAGKTQERVQQLTADPHFDAASYAAQTGDTETAFHARQALRNRTLGEKPRVVGNTLADPATYGHAIEGVGKFALGLAATPLHTIAQAGATIGAPIAGALGADKLQHTLENEQQTQGAEATLAAQQIEQSLRGVGRGIRNTAQDLIGADQDEATQRAHFAAEIKAAKNAGQLAQSRPLDTGVVAGAAKLATGNENLADVYSPEALQAQGARPVSELVTGSMAAAADPTNLLIPMAGEIPGVKTLAGGLVQGAGKVASGVGKGLGYAANAQRAFHVPILTALTHGLTGGLEAQAAKLGTQLGSRAFNFIGDALGQQGAAMRSGIPSALDQTAQQALSAGERAVGTNIQRGIGNAAGNITATALGFAPINYAMAGGDPRQFTESEVGAGAMGGIFGLAGERARMEDIAHYRLAQYGAQQFTDNPLFAAHQATMAKFSPADQQAINALRGTLHGGTGTDVLVLDGPSFAQQVGAIGGDARGQYAWDEGTIYINADAVGKTPGQKARGALDTAGHETGHAVADFLRKAGRESDARAMLESIMQSVPADQLIEMVKGYHSKLLASTDLTGKTPQEVEAIRQQIVSDNPTEKILEENLAEITRRILSGKNIAGFALPKPLMERVMDSAAQWMEAHGWSPKVDPNATLGFKAQMVKDAARRMSDTLYETGKRASAAAGAGETEGQRLLKAQNDLANIPPITPQTPTATAAVIRRQQAAAQKVVDEIQGPRLTPAPARTTPEPAPQRVVDNTQPTATTIGIPISPVETPKLPNVPEAPPAPNEPIPPSTEKSGEVSPIPEETTPKTATAVAEPPKPTVNQEQEEARIAELVAKAERVATDAEKKPDTAAAKERIKRAKIKAILDDLDANPNGLHRVKDEFGNEKIVGDYDPNDPRHVALVELSPEDQQKVAATQASKGKVIYMRYRSALSNAEQSKALTGEATRENTDTGMDTRRKEYAADAAEARTQGTVQQKAVIPISTSVSVPGGKLSVHIVALDNLLHNMESIFDGLKTVAKDNPYGASPREQQALIVQDAQAYADNHAHGYRGDGSGSISQFPDSNLPRPDANYTPQPIPKERFDILNMAFHEEGASKLAKLTEQVGKYAAEGKAVPPSKQAQFARAKELYALAAENNRFTDPETGETNELRAQLKAAGFDTDKNLKSPFESLSPQHILETSDTRITQPPEELSTVRPTSFDIDPAKLGEKGLPQRKAVASGFMPSDTPHDDMANQASWMDSEAKRIGYSSIDNLVAEDPGAFKKMAVQWRVYHPRDEQGMLLQNEASRVINNTLYGDQKSDSTRPLAGARDALGNAEAFLRGSIGAGAETNPATERAAIAKWAKDNGISTSALPAQFDLNSKDNVGGNEHDVWFDQKSQRWVKATRGSGSGMGMRPDVSRGGWQLRNASPLEYLESRQLQNQVFGDDIRVHGVWDDGKNVNVITSQPHVSGEKPTQPQIDSAMEERGFRRMDDATYYRKSDNIAVFDLHPNNAFIHEGSLLPIDAIVVHPSEELLDAMRDSQLALLNRKPAPSGGGSFMDAARARLAETTEKRAVNFMPDTGTPEEGGTPGERLAREAEQAGVVLKTEQLKGLVREDKNIMDKIRERIQQQTGKPARFMPSDEIADRIKKATIPFKMEDINMGSHSRASMFGRAVWMTKGGDIVPVPDSHHNATAAKLFGMEPDGEDGNGDAGNEAAFSNGWVRVQIQPDGGVVNVSGPRRLNATQKRNIKDWAAFHDYEVENDTGSTGGFMPALSTTRTDFKAAARARLNPHTSPETSKLPAEPRGAAGMSPNPSGNNDDKRRNIKQLIRQRV